MTDDTQYLIITPQRVGYGVAPPPEGGPVRVVVTMNYDSSDAPWLAPNIRLALSMTPEEARSMAQALGRMADKAES